jgi:hypothetical protein
VGGLLITCSQAWIFDIRGDNLFREVFMMCSLFSSTQDNNVVDTVFFLNLRAGWMDDLELSSRTDLWCIRRGGGLKLILDDFVIPQYSTVRRARHRECEMHKGNLRQSPLKAKGTNDHASLTLFFFCGSVTHCDGWCVGRVDVGRCASLLPILGLGGFGGAVRGVETLNGWPSGSGTRGRIMWDYDFLSEW